MKRIVICADGTWNKRDQLDEKTGKRRPTNVTKLARAVLPRTADGVDQVVFYNDGIGTGGPLDRFSGGAFGDGMEAHIRALYRFIVYNHVPGDELYFFGFSRGAFTVRSLAGFMNKLGLVSKSDDYYVPELYACYEKEGAAHTSPEWQLAFHKVDATAWRPCPPIRFIGVWDTVGALGAPGLLGQIFNRNKYKYHDVGLNEHIQNAFHAVAIDEQRKPFAPTLWQRPPGWPGALAQAWFPGVHSDVGGGLTPDGLANEALHWLVEQAERLGLVLNAAFLQHYLPFFNSTLHESMTNMYRVMGPLERRIGEFAADGETVHRSALDRLGHADSHYAPANLKRFVDAGGADKTPPADTTRIARGTPFVPGPPRDG